MKNIFKCFIILLISLFFINNKVNAETYNCEYEDDRGVSAGWWIFTDTTKKFQYTVDTDNKTISSENVHNYSSTGGNTGSGKIDAIADFLAESSRGEAYYVDKMDGKCADNIYICKYNHYTLNLYTVLFDDSLRNDIENSSLYLFLENGKNVIFSDQEKCRSYAQEKTGRGQEYCEKKYELKDKTNDCVKFKIDSENSDKESVKLEFECKYYKESVDNLDDLKTKYDNCKKNGNNCGSEATDYSNELNKLKEYCKNVISHQNYSDTCMTKCLIDFKEDIKKYSLEDTEVTVKCSLTEDIIAMVYNVLKWVKYILPALVIILTMLDFIKAIAAQNDDDMKKAQGKFVKRLIVAALLFLLPLIINFVLQTFGFYDSSCDITDLFKN